MNKQTWLEKINDSEAIFAKILLAIFIISFILGIICMIKYIIS